MATCILFLQRNSAFRFTSGPACSSLCAPGLGRFHKQSIFEPRRPQFANACGFFNGTGPKLNEYFLFACSVSKHTFIETAGNAHARSWSAVAVAVVILYVVDQLLNAGRYSEVVADALIQVGSAVGIHV
jgi:hypothetical protein